MVKREPHPSLDRQGCNTHSAPLCEGDYNYADAEHCGIINGSLFVIGTVEEDFALLHTPQEVLEDFQIKDKESPALFSVDSLTTVGKSLTIGNNPALEASSLDSITNAGGRFYLHYVESLPTLSGDSIENIGETLSFAHNTELHSISSGGLLFLGRNLSWRASPSLCSEDFLAFRDTMISCGWTGVSGIPFAFASFIYDGDESQCK